MYLTKLNKNHIDEIYELQISNSLEISNNIWNEREMKELMKKNNFFSVIALKNKKIEGFGFFFQFNNYLDIYSLLVAPKSRNKGVANEIIEHTVAYCKSKKIKKIVLEVNETNIKAINFYKKKKFVTLGTRKNYYKLGNRLFDAILMERKILI